MTASDVLRLGDDDHIEMDKDNAVEVGQDKKGADKTVLQFCNEWSENDVDIITAPIYQWEQKRMSS